ncbi:sensor histidine kinase [Streptomyces sp. G45]|uniref:sensor histidine kinase n=1 Tax=Streptomyces sp. G45 TaxID=3406627 RepID=UPI003C14BAF3
MLTRARLRRLSGARPSRQEVLVALGTLVIDLTGYAVALPPGGRWSAGVVALYVLSVVPLAWHRRFPVAALVAVLAALAVLTLVVPIAYRMPICLIVALFSVARLRAARVTAGATALSLAVLQIPGPVPEEEWWHALLGDVVGLSVAVVVGCAVRQWQRQLALHRELLAANAVADERRRIARELHDVVAHHITAMQLMAGGARKVLHHDVHLAQDALKSLEDSGRLALSEMRQLLDVLRADDTDHDGRPSPPQPGIADLPRVVADSRQAGVPTELRVEGERRELAPTLGLTVFRIVQESLTNVRKHAGRARATVLLDYGPELLTVQVYDDGAGGGATSRKGRAGHGLVGMRERVALHDGTLEAGARPEGGFRVAATLPLPAPAPESARDEEVVLR